MTALELNSNFTDHIVGGVNHLLPQIPVAFFDSLLGFILIRLTVRLTRWSMKLLKVQQGLRGVVSSTLETLLWIYLIITVLGDLGFNGLVPFFTGSFAAIGIAMAVGGSTLISDIVAGVFLGRDQDFNVGDEVIAGEAAPERVQGIIESMDARRTRIRGTDGKLHVIPNSVVERKEWILINKRPEAATLGARASQVAGRMGAAALEKRTKKVKIAKQARENNQ